jgi:hypothetical protein
MGNNNSGEKIKDFVMVNIERDNKIVLIGLFEKSIGKCLLR